MSLVISSICLTLLGIIHLLPGVGMLSASRLTQLYGVPVDEPNLEILLRHRAVLFALLGAYLLLAAWHTPWQRVAYVAAFISVTSFLVLAYTTGQNNTAIARVVAIDWLAVVLTLTGYAAFLMSNP
ncbi:MAG TPA: phosphopantetheine adenylyltransferase [Limnobacter sp.]|uniref:phosphopantetheine adenylyltransferase n=1 Tax=Limnobacter sp. TaxID=2003368 RepID=UPI002EDA9E7A